MSQSDTIVAISSAVGPAARMIVRASGVHARELASEIADDDIPAGASRRSVRIRHLSISAWIYSFRLPKSYTGEDLVEFHIPGNPLLARWLIEDLISRGARAAEPGEFTARAYFNGKIDLSEAEGIAASIAAQNEQELNAARQLLAGELARRLKAPMDRLAETLGLVEAGIDFSEEDVSFLSLDELRRRVEQIDAALKAIVDNSARFDRLSHDVQIVLVGRPNAGKSTLLNALAGEDRAVVSPVAGTTRDAISARVALKRGYAQITDIAGLDDAPASDEMERQMQQRAREMIERADVLVMLRDMTDPRAPMENRRPPDLLIGTKADLPTSSGWKEPWIAISAVTGQNLPLLRERLDELAFGQPNERGLALNARHLRCIDDARGALSLAKAQDSEELIAFELRGALDALGQIRGAVSPDEVLGNIFATFCIGK